MENVALVGMVVLVQLSVRHEICHEIYTTIFLGQKVECMKFQQIQYKITISECESCTSMRILQKGALFSGKIYTACTNFTNLNSGQDLEPEKYF